MEPFEREGIFWQSDKPELSVAGRLSYRPTEGSSLDLLGSFDDPAVAFSVINQITPRRINGVAGGKEVTLEGCLVRNVSLSSPGLLRQDYYVPIVLEGAHFSSDDALEFETLTVGFDQLPQWINKSPFNISLQTDKPDDLTTAKSLTIVCEIPPDKSEVSDNLKVELSHVWSVKGDKVVEVNASQHPRLSLKYQVPRPLLDIITDINGIQDLITLAVDAVTVATSIQLRRSDITRELSTADRIEVPISAYWSNMAEHALDVRPSNNTALFSFDQVDGLKAIARWVTVSRTYRPVLGLLLTIRYSVRLYEENKYSNVVSAAETFHRLRFANEIMPSADYKSYRRKLVRTVRGVLGSRAGNWLNSQLLYSNEPRLRQRIVDLANYAGEGFAVLVGDTDQWARVATWLRNRLTHHDPNQATKTNPADISAITDSIFVLVMLALLRECELPSEVFENLARSPRLSILQNELAEIAPRLSQLIRS